MAEVDSNQQSETIQDNEERLKYLDFIQVATLHVIVFFSSLYEFAKGKSGPLKPGVQTVEGTVKTVIGPVYEKFQDVPFQLLKFIDHKVDEYVPSLLKEASGQAFSTAQKAPDVAKSVASEVHRIGMIETATNIGKKVYTKYEPTAKELYSKYEPVAEQYAVSAWLTLNRLPLFPQVAEIVVPTTAYWTEKYNQTVCNSVERGYTVASYLPLVPIERIAKVFGNEENVKTSSDSNETKGDDATMQ